MRAKHESLSRRRPRRADGLVYRQTRRLANGRRKYGLPVWAWIAVAVAVVILIALIWWWKHRS